MNLIISIITSILILLTMSCLIATTLADPVVISVTDFGAKGDGRTDSSQAFVMAWTSACSSEVPATMYVPRKRFLISSPVEFQGPCNGTKIEVKIDGSIVAPDGAQSLGSSDSWIMFSHVEGLVINGGAFDGVGSSLWACKASQQSCPEGPTTLTIFGSNNVEIRRVTSINAKLYHIVVHSCENVTLEGVRIYAPKDSPNTDGVHVQNSMNVRILDTGIRTGDDCISIGPGTRNLWIQRVACGPGHGISIGSLGKGLEEDGVENVTVKNVVFSGTQNGLRIKSWGRPSNGYVKGVVFKQVVMNDVQNPILIDQNYCPRNEGCPNQNSGIKISGITYTDIKGTSASRVAMKFDCSDTSPCMDIGLQDIELTYQKQPAQSFCKNVRGMTLGVVNPPSCL
ncbi:hypothetical protein Sjap_006075 [Stephania japonica]|uniref:Polygalacturonase n=1 Tax=Stephania japonica TaxID=461633 RepID=A0AAP0K594_9MAGN